MWKRASSLSPFNFSSRSSWLNQAAFRFTIWESFSSEIIHPEKCSTSPEETRPYITFVLGGPGSGKGTQCEKIVETFGFKHLSAGDLLRREIASNSKHGTMILNLIREGNIVPSEVTVELIQKEMKLCDDHKFLIDGFPRTEENRIAFEQILGMEPDIVLYFECPEEEMVKRVLHRNQGRVDDNIDTFKKRLKVFEALSLPVINYYKKKGKLHTVKAIGSVDDIFEQVLPVFASCKVTLNQYSKTDKDVKT